MSAKWIGMGVVMLAMNWQSLTAGEIVIKDDFDRSEDKTPLHGRATETGDALWEASRNVVLIKDEAGGSVAFTDNKSAVAKVKLPAGDGIVITAEVSPKRDTQKKGAWLAIGFGNGRGATWENGVVCILHAGGALECFYGPPGSPRIQIWPSRTVPVNDSTDKVKLSLQYEKSSNVVTVCVDEVVVIKTHSLGDFHPSLDYAGFSGVQLKPGTSLLDNFSLVVTNP